MYKARSVLTLSAAVLALCSAPAAWAQVACNGNTPLPCINPSASDATQSTAGGTGALASSLNFAGYGNNTAFGYYALNATAPAATDANGNATGGQLNSAFGYDALLLNTSGSDNSAFGASALTYNTSGTANIALGSGALELNTTGNNNIGIGAAAMKSNEAGSSNTVIGGFAFFSASSGSNNVMVGQQAGAFTNSGSGNVILGTNAGNKLSNGSNNVYLASPGGAATESGIIRIGTLGTQTAAYIAGVHGVSVSGGSLLVINSSGQLGTILSSARYKTDIQDMGERSVKLAELRPVTFHYKTDPSGDQQYGLIAEEVAKVYPDLVVHGEHGEIESVQYQQLIPMLLNELQKQQKLVKQQTAELVALRAKSGEIDALKVAVQQLQKTQPALQAANSGAAATVASR